MRHYLDLENELSGEAKDVELSQDIGLSPGIPRFQRFRMFRVQTTRRSVSWNGETPYHEYFKNLSDEERVRFITSSPGLGTTLRVCHIYQAPKETVKVDWPECGLAFRKHDLWVHLVENNFGTVCFFPACDHRSRMRNNLYPTFTNTLIPPIWQKKVGNYIVLGQAA